MFLLHLSDIHFRARDTSTQQDPNKGLRSKLLADVVARFKAFGESPAQILVSGDIAYAGAKEEYDFARKWFNELCDALEIPQNNVFVVPGNHDVDQVVSEHISVKVIHDYIKTKATAERSDTFRELLNDTSTAETLYKALQNYNDFAAGYSCLLNPPNDTLANDTLDLGNGWKLNLIGLNSAFVSSRSDEEGSLFVDNPSFSIQSSAGSINLVMCHHPYKWLRYGEELKNNLDAVAEIQLFGHEHIVRPEIGRDYVRLRSPAIQPDAEEAPWQPGYNIIEVNIEDAAVQKWLKVKAHIYCWQETSPQFVPLFDKGGVPYFEHRISIANLPTDAVPAAEVEHARNDQPRTIEQGQNAGGTVMSEPLGKSRKFGLRDLTFRFFALSYPQQSKIVVELKLNAEEDANKPAAIRFSNALKRAKNRDILDEVLAAVKEQEKDK